VITDHPDHLAATYAMQNLVDIATQEDDVKSRVEFLKKITFDVKRSKLNERIYKRCFSKERKLIWQQTTG